MKLKYGRKELEFEIESSRVIDILTADEKTGIKDPEAAVEAVSYTHLTLPTT